MTRRLPHFIWLVAVWVALWADPSLANVISGTIVAGTVLIVFGEAGPRPASPVRPVAALRYLAVFASMLVQSTVLVAVQVMQPPGQLRPGIIAVRVRGVSDAIVTLVANSITLTPGTMTIDTTRDNGDCTLYVHALDLRDPDQVRADIRRLERLAVAAFGPEQVGPGVSA